MKRLFFLIAACGLITATSVFTKAQTPNSQQLIQLQEAEITRLATTVDELRPLNADGLIARVEVEKAEKDLAAARTKLEEIRAQIATAEKLAAAEAAKIKSFVKPTSMSLNNTSAVLRSTTGSWSMANLSTVQQFFFNTFGRTLPTSTIGQSATHNRMGWNHRNAVDVGVHPDSAEGRALIEYLQSSRIPFLAFRKAIPGVSTGPHIHIGTPSQRMG